MMPSSLLFPTTLLLAIGAPISSAATKRTRTAKAHFVRASSVEYTKPCFCSLCVLENVVFSEPLLSTTSWIPFNLRAQIPPVRNDETSMPTEENILRGVEEALAMPPAAVLRPVRSAEDGSDDDVPSFSLDTSASNELEIKRRPDEPMFNLLLPFKVSAFGACVALVVERTSQTARTVLHWLKRWMDVLSR
ncbi:uncharacterized protein LAESUDRAFT_808205 [Laetiporus sulphureus 93-53]|uniref:Uncharacterized protein n=1 Tax=Laetiporus sulphureus 93-53 TaxID=1314785 RepID=A0A165I5U0_9APHY|nr:uncharacterized protein LAESUDRAFT_808205 [Laetiporus sulphureus 93-53]KZT12630.1 hypothetical protein LAESUDRAFT_808205 [Laetiporus sulphureus 93-53]